MLRIACSAAWLNAPRRKCAHSAASPLKSRPAALGSEFVHSVPASRADLSGSNLLRVVQSLGSLSIRIMQTHLFYQQNCNYPFLPFDFRLRHLNVSLLLPSHNLHQMSQCSVFKVHRELSLIETFNSLKASINKLSYKIEAQRSGFDFERRKEPTEWKFRALLTARNWNAVGFF